MFDARGNVGKLFNENSHNFNLSKTFNNKISSKTHLNLLKNSIKVILKQQLNAHASAQLSQWKHPRDIFPTASVIFALSCLNYQNKQRSNYMEINIRTFCQACMKFLEKFSANLS